MMTFCGSSSPRVGDPADRNEVVPSKTIFLECGVQHGARRRRKHEIALPDAGRQEFGRIFALLLPFKVAGDFLVLLYEHATTAQRIDGAPFARFLPLQ
jgi:hypothetical protein